VSTHSVCLKDADEFARGGLAKKAKHVKDAGRYGDDMVIHINSDEYEKLRSAWGEPTINPDTGMPEFFLSGLKGWLKENPWVAPVASTLGSAVLGPVAGSALGALGVPASYAGLAGSALTGGAIGALTGGGLKGGLTGAALGATVSPYLGNWMAGTSLGQGLGLQNTQTIGSLFGSGNNPIGASSNGLRSEAAMEGAKKAGSSSILGGLFGGNSGSGGSSVAPLLLGALALGSVAGNKGAKGSTTTGPTATSQAPPGYGSHLKPVDFTRQNVSADMPEVDYYTYGQRPQKAMFTNNQLPGVTPYAEGGEVDADEALYGHVGRIDHPSGMGSDGRADDINAVVSDGEYIFDAESVALLGNGSTDAGAAALDEMRKNLRKHKGAALAKGKISPHTKAPESYLPGAR
jgi:hypothetical protein